MRPWLIQRKIYAEAVYVKTTKRGFKAWCRADVHSGFTSYFQVYLGATDSAEKELGIRATLDMCRDIFDKGFHIYCDNFFACPQLAARLAQKKTYCIGTVKKGRVGFTNFNTKQVKTLNRGEDISNVNLSRQRIPPLLMMDHTVKYMPPK